MRFFFMVVSFLCESVLFCSAGCPRIPEMLKISSTKCVAGRRFFARLDENPSYHRETSTLLRPYLFPWLAGVISKFAGKETTCTGTLINDRYIITAQSCVYPPIESENVKVILGYYGDYEVINDTFISKPEHLNVTQIILYPAYDPTDLKTVSNNIALLKIPALQYKKNIYPIELPLPGQMSVLNPVLKPTFENAFWGLSDKFEVSKVKLIKDEDCSNYSAFYSIIMNPQLICTTGLNWLKPGKCNESNGAPLMIQEKKRIYGVTILIGILAWGIQTSKPCELRKNPLIYVKISSKLHWIKENTKDAHYCQY